MGSDASDERDQGRRLDLAAWRQILGYVLGYRRQATWLGLTAALTAACDAGFPLVTRAVVDGVGRDRELGLWPYGLAYLGLALALTLSIWTFIRLAGGLAARVGHDIRRDGFARLQELSFAFYDRHPVGWLMARMTSDADRLARILAWGLLDVVWGVMTMAAVAIVLLVLAPRLAVVVLAVVPLLGWLSLRFQRRILASARRVRRANSTLTAAYSEALMAVKTTKALGREEPALDEFRRLSGEMHDASVANAVAAALYLPLVGTVASLGTGLALVLGGAEVAALGLSLGTWLAFLAYTTRFFEPLQETARVFAELQMAQASAERVSGLLAAEPEVRDSAEVQRAIERERGRPPVAGRAVDGGRDRVGEIELVDVGFAYRRGRPVLDGVSFRARAGERIALVGPTGGGKTTIVSLICRFYEPTRGRILLDGVDYRDRSLEWLQSTLGIVQQAPHLFSGTIADNIRYGRLDASDAEVEEAARLAGAHDLIVRGDGGYRRQVGEGGGLLSTGERQLVALARAALARPQILVLDEATSSVDTETERRIEAGLGRILDGPLSLIIAHRLSTIRAADRILFVDGGRIVEAGRHDELLARRGRYFELYTGQRLRHALDGGDGWAQAPTPA